MSPGRVVFAGCGPGAPDLLTLRAVDALRSADIVIWNASLLDRETLAAHLRADAEIVQWPPATPDDIHAAFRRALADDLLVVRCKGGDPTLLGDIGPELRAARELGLTCEIVPGVSAAGAAAAAARCELATTADPVLLVDMAGLAGAPAGACGIAVHGASRDPLGLQRTLLARGLDASTPCVVAIEVSRRGETLIACRLAELAETVQDFGLGVLTLVLVGRDPGPGGTLDA